LIIEKQNIRIVGQVLGKIFFQLAWKFFLNENFLLYQRTIANCISAILPKKN